MQRRGRLRRLVSRSGADAILLSAPKESVSARKPIFTAAGHRPVSPARSLEPLSELDVAVPPEGDRRDRKSTRLNSSHSQISYAVFCLKKKKTEKPSDATQRVI